MKEVTLRPDAPRRSVLDVDKGDFIKTASGWKEIAFNSIAGVDPESIRRWTIGTTDGAACGMFAIMAYAKAEDFEEFEEVHV